MSTSIEIMQVKNIYEKIAPHFNNTRVYTWNWINTFLKTLPIDSVVYDIGCGNGRNMNYNNLKFIGIDNCENFIKICKEKNLEVINANIINIPLKNKVNN